MYASQAHENSLAKCNHKRKVLFDVAWIPRREITITWWIDSQLRQLTIPAGPWRHTLDEVDRGVTVTLMAENHGMGGYLQCTIYVDGKILIPGPNDEWSAYAHRNDAGDCKVNVIIP